MIKLPDKAYNILKWLVLVVIPAATTLYVTLDQLFGWGVSKIVATLSAATCTFIGSIIGVSSVSYYQQQNEAEDNEEYED